MSEKKAGVETLPEHVRRHLDELRAALDAILADRLVGVIVHGSVVRGEYRPGDSDVDIVVVVSEIGFADLEQMGNALQVARYAARIEAMILTEQEIAGASDAFPLLYDEIKRWHVVVCGRDPFAAVEVHFTHRRLRVEQELREAQIRLRRVVTDSFGAREAVGGAVMRKVKQVRSALHALLEMKGVASAPDLSSVITKVGEVYGVDAAPLRAARESPEAAHAALVTLLDKAIRDVNGMESAPSGGGG